MCVTIESKIREIIHDNDFDLEKPVDEIGLEDDLLDLGLDSVNAIRLIVGIESEFGFEFYDEDLTTDNVSDIQKIISYVKSRL